MNTQISALQSPVALLLEDTFFMDAYLAIEEGVAEPEVEAEVKVSESSDLGAVIDGFLQNWASSVKSSELDPTWDWWFLTTTYEDFKAEILSPVSDTRLVRSFVPCNAERHCRLGW